MIALPGKSGSTEGKSRDRLRKALDRVGVSERMRLWLSVVAALFVLNLSLTFHNVWPTLWVTTRHELSVEIAVLFFALSLYSGVGKRREEILAAAKADIRALHVENIQELDVVESVALELGRALLSMLLTRTGTRSGSVKWRRASFRWTTRPA